MTDMSTEMPKSPQYRRGRAKPATQSPRHLETIQSWDDVPRFVSEPEEAAYWATHDTGKRLLDQMQPIPPEGAMGLPTARAPASAAPSRPISVRLDDDILRRLKALAARKKKGYQTLLKEFVVERVYEEEKREGII
jgi:hypothetical protein